MNNEEYVATQRNVNSLHMNGRQEAEFEEAIHHTRTFTSWLRAHDLPTESFLDSGCRTGYAMEELWRQYPAARVVGVDIVPEFIIVADKRGEAVVGDMQALPFEDEEFDWTFSCTSIEHCPDIPAAVAEMQRTSRYGFYVHTDLEDDKAFAKNPSHFAHHEDPGGWLDAFSHPEWWIVYLNVPRNNRVEMIWMRKQYAKQFLIKEDAPHADLLR
jgi:ubiquinone/menaquinone biosynthesis C-methylase UbiE